MAFTHVSSVCVFIGKIIMFDGGAVFDLHNGSCFDAVVVLFNSRICIWEFSGRVNVLIVRDKFSSLQVWFLSFFLLFFFLRKCILCVYVSSWVLVSKYVYAYFRVFLFLFVCLFSFIIFSLVNILWYLICHRVHLFFSLSQYVCVYLRVRVCDVA